MNKLFWLGYGLMWLSVSIAISIAIYFTHDIKCLWFFMIPALIKIKTGRSETESEDKE